MKEIQSIKSSVTEHLVRYIISYACNYHCKDCYQSAKPRQVPTKEFIHSIAIKLSRLLNCFTDGLPITLYLEGGEVSLFNIIEDVLKYIDGANIKNLKIVTNLSAPLSYYKRLQDYCTNKKYNLRLLASFHLEQCKPEEFFTKVSVLKPNSVLVVVDNQNYLNYKFYLDYMKANGIFFNISPKKYDEEISTETAQFIAEYQKDIKQERYEITYTDKTTEKKEAFELEQGFDWSFVNNNFLCTHRNNLMIQPDGQLLYYGCKGKIGNILSFTENDFKRLDFSLDLCQAKKHCNWKCANYHIERIS